VFFRGLGTPGAGFERLVLYRAPGRLASGRFDARGGGSGGGDGGSGGGGCGLLVGGIILKIVVVVEQQTGSGAIRIVILAASDRPDKAAQAQAAQNDGNGDQDEQDVHRTYLTRIAFASTVSEETDIAIAASSGVA
jgi:predicted metalloprotease